MSRKTELEQGCEMMPSRLGVAITPMNSQNLCLTVHDLYEKKPVCIPAWMGEPLVRPHLYLRSYSFGGGNGERVTCLGGALVNCSYSGGSPHVRVHAGNTNWPQWDI